MGTIYQIRRYRDGRMAYLVAPLEGEKNGALFGPDELRATGQSASPSTFTNVGRFRIREIVRVSGHSSSESVRGLVGIVRGGSIADEIRVLVWFDALREMWILRDADLESTGKRLPPTRTPPSSSLQVNERGEVLGLEEYIVVADVEDL